jgi:hypothetical protein
MQSLCSILTLSPTASAKSTRFPSFLIANEMKISQISNCGILAQLNSSQYKAYENEPPPPPAIKFLAEFYPHLAETE